MKNSMSNFKPSWPRFFLDYEVARVLADLCLKENSRCLNLGCGTEGRYADLLASFDIDGVDIAEIGDRLQPWRYHQCDAKKLPFPDHTFDICIAIESFEHIPDNVDAMREVARTLKPGGVAIITTPTLWTWLFEFGRHGPHYYSKERLINLAESAGLQCFDFIACGGLLFYLAGLIKSWVSPLGLRVFGRNWWKFIDGLLMPLYVSSRFTDRFLPFPPSNWLLMARK